MRKESEYVLKNRVNYFTLTYAFVGFGGKEGGVMRCRPTKPFTLGYFVATPLV